MPQPSGGIAMESICRSWMTDLAQAGQASLDVTQSPGRARQQCMSRRPYRAEGCTCRVSQPASGRERLRSIAFPPGSRRCHLRRRPASPPPRDMSPPHPNGCWTAAGQCPRAPPQVRLSRAGCAEKVRKTIVAAILRDICRSLAVRRSSVYLGIPPDEFAARGLVAKVGGLVQERPS